MRRVYGLCRGIRPYAEIFSDDSPHEIFFRFFRFPTCTIRKGVVTYAPTSDHQKLLGPSVLPRNWIDEKVLKPKMWMKQG